jgi:hypothetical protein
LIAVPAKRPKPHRTSQLGALSLVADNNRFWRWPCAGDDEPA